MPKIYDIGYIQEEPDLPRPPNTKPSNTGGTICIVMEYSSTLETEIGNGKMLDTIQKINKYFYSVYKGLELINGITPSIHFRHGDLKYNNLLITEDLKPIIIDFGFSEFEIDSKIKFKAPYQITNYWNGYSCTNDILKTKINYFGVLPLGKSLNQTLDILNSTHDMFQLIYSLVFVLQNYDTILFEYLNSNSKKYFLNGSSVKNIIMQKFPSLNISEILSKLYDINLLYFIDSYKLVESIELIKLIGPGLLPSDSMDLFARYNLKYLKYKEKYLRLKN